MNGLLGSFPFVPREQIVALERYASTLLAPKVHPLRRRSLRHRIALHSYDLDFSLKDAKLTADVTLYQRNNGRWYARFTLNGKRYMVSTGETDKTRALLKLGKIVEKGTVQDTAGIKQNCTFAELEKEYSPYARNNKSPSTVARERYTMHILLRAFGKMKLKEITALVIERYKQSRIKEVKPSSINRELSLLKNMLSKSVEWGFIETNPASKVKSFKEPAGRMKWLNDSERERLLAECKQSENPLLYAVVFTALNTGMRKSELQRLTWDNVDFEKALITVKQTKNNETRFIPVTKELLKVLSNLYNERPHSHYVFSKPDGTAYGNWRRAFENACFRAGIKDFRFHDLRHTFGSYLGSSGFNAFTIKALMGHKTLTMADRYTHISDSTLKAAVDKIGAKMVQGEINPLDNLSSDEFTTGR